MTEYNVNHWQNAQASSFKLVQPGDKIKIEHDEQGGVSVTYLKGNNPQAANGSGTFANLAESSGKWQHQKIKHSDPTGSGHSDFYTAVVTPVEVKPNGDTTSLDLSRITMVAEGDKLHGVLVEYPGLNPSFHSGQWR